MYNEKVDKNVYQKALNFVSFYINKKCTKQDFFKFLKSDKNERDTRNRNWM